jgi:polyferredoxin
MARKAWIAVLGFGLLLFVLLDLLFVLLVVTHQMKPSTLGVLLPLGFATWSVYLAMRKRIESES